MDQKIYKSSGSETETMTMAEIKKMQKKLALLEEENTPDVRLRSPV